MTGKRVLVACEFSGVVRDAFARAGCDAWSCDLLPTEKPGKHIQGDVLQILDYGWDLLIAHPPCTRLCNSGVCWLEKRNLWLDMFWAAKFFRNFLDAPIPMIAVENPIPHKYAREIIGKYTQTIQPYQFGHVERKTTCLWLKNLPPLKPTWNREAENKALPKHLQNPLHYLPPSQDRGHLRSVTYPGIAEAMAAQWSTWNLVTPELFSNLAA